MALPVPLRRRGEIVGICCGVVCFSLAFFGGSLGAMLPNGPAGVVLPMVFFSMIAGAIACRRGRADAQELASGFGPRVGIRAALIAALTGGALTVFAASLHALGIGRPASGDLRKWPNIPRPFMTAAR